jgi:hypothetical protein
MDAFSLIPITDTDFGQAGITESVRGFLYGLVWIQLLVACLWEKYGVGFFQAVYMGKTPSFRQCAGGIRANTRAMTSLRPFGSR